MKIKNDQLGQAAELRRLAEEIVSGKTASIPENLSPEQMQRVFHELQVHQIELEMQNEELRRTQEELVSARMRYFDLYDLAPVGYCIISKLGLILEANLTLATLLGRAKGILINSPLSSFILTEDQDTFYRCRNTICATGTPQTFELRLKKGKALFWARFVMSAAMDEGGIPIHRVVVSDITDLKHTENELKLLNNTLEQRVLEITAKNREKDHLLIQQSRYAVMGEMIGHVAHQCLDIAEGAGDPGPAHGAPLRQCLEGGPLPGKPPRSGPRPLSWPGKPSPACFGGAADAWLGFDPGGGAEGW